MRTATVPEILWEPNPGPQEELLACPIEDIGYGGARGGGKTQGMLGDFMSHEHEYGKHARGIFFRRTYGELEEVIRQADALLIPQGWKKTGGSRGPVTYKAPSGATLKLRAMQRDSDAEKYQGHSYTWVGFDEATNWPSPDPLDKLRACLRQSEAQVRKRFICSANPGGAGHNWYKARYIDPAPPWTPFEDSVTVPGMDGKPMTVKILRVFIPSTLDDNPQLMKNDPMYWVNVVISANGREDLIKAWRYGLWNIVAGGMFDDLWLDGRYHILPPFPIPHSWRINRSFDWGSSKPYSVGFWAECDGTQPLKPNGETLLKRTFSKGTIFRIAEIYGWNGKPNQGLKRVDIEIAKEIIAFEEKMGWRWGKKPEQSRVQPGPADSSIYDPTGNGASIAENMAKHGVKWTKADKSPGSIKNGCELIRSRLSASTKMPMEEPGMFVFSNCIHGFIRTLPVLPRDKDNPDIPDPKAEDHCPDEVRYRCLEVRREIKTTRLGGL